MTKNVNVVMNDHEKEQHFQAKKAEMQKKYRAQIANFCKFHNVDLSVGWDMLFFNARCFALGLKGEAVPGGGTVDVQELAKDYKEIAQYIIWQA